MVCGDPKFGKLGLPSELLGEERVGVPQEIELPGIPHHTDTTSGTVDGFTTAGMAVRQHVRAAAAAAEGDDYGAASDYESVEHEEGEEGVSSIVRRMSRNIVETVFPTEIVPPPPPPPPQQQQRPRSESDCFDGEMGAATRRIIVAAGTHHTIIYVHDEPGAK